MSTCETPVTGERDLFDPHFLWTPIYDQLVEELADNSAELDPPHVGVNDSDQPAPESDEVTR